MSKGVFVTGFPGFIAGRLFERLVETHPEGTRFLFLVESRFVFHAQQRCEQLQDAHPALRGRWHVVEGDITRPGLGMTDAALALVREVVDTVWHLAALYDLAAPLSPSRAVNVEGTLNVLDLCETLPHLQRLLYVSTCYVAGDRTGRVYEDELDVGQGFKNHYESTKCWAEAHVRRRLDRVPAVIFRPAIVVGDATTGETIKGDGPYYVMNLLLRLPRWLPMVNLGEGAARVNLVPVDYLIEALVRIAGKPEAIGRTFHIADPNPLTARQILDAIVADLDRAPVLGALPAGLSRRLLGVGALRRTLGIPEQLLDYFDHPVEFDVANTSELLEPEGVACPRLPEYLPRLVEYARAHPAIFSEVS